MLSRADGEVCARTGDLMDAPAALSAGKLVVRAWPLRGTPRSKSMGFGLSEHAGGETACASFHALHANCGRLRAPLDRMTSQHCHQVSRFDDAACRRH